MLFKWFSRLLHTIVFLALLYIFSYLFAPLLAEASPITNAFINEIHYDNIGGDVNEYVEIAGDASIDLSSWSLWLYNGSKGDSYKSFDLTSWTHIDIGSQFGFLKVQTTGIQNGSPDGLVLFDGMNVIQFLSYEGIMSANSDIAKGITSTDIAVQETTDTPIGFSLQLAGLGSSYDDFTWSSPQENTFGSSNFGQQFTPTATSTFKVSGPQNLSLFFLAFIFLLYFLLQRTTGKIPPQLVRKLNSQYK